MLDKKKKNHAAIIIVELMDVNTCAFSELKDEVDNAIDTLETAIEAAVAKYGLTLIDCCSST
jgi:hypothetical protein